MSSVRASSSASPRSSNSGRPSKSCLVFGSRTATTIATDSASSRRATKPRIIPEAASSHCASSTRQSSGRSSAAADSRPSTASPTRNRSGTSPDARPKATFSASCCGCGSVSSRSSTRHAELVDPGERQLHLRLHARDLRHAESRRATAAYRSSAVFPMPASPRMTRTRALTLAHLCEKPVEQFALVGPVEKPGRKPSVAGHATPATITGTTGRDWTRRPRMVDNRRNLPGGAL